MSKIILAGHILVSQSDLSAVRQALPEHCEATRNEQGCLVFKVDEDPLESGKFHVYEEFVNKEAFERHQTRVRASQWGEISRDVQRCYTVTGLDD